MALIQMDYMADSIQRWTTSWVYLPQDETGAEGPLKVVYLLHGFFGNHIDWISRTNVMEEAARHNTALVMPDGDNSWYLNYPERFENYETYLAKELPALMSRTFPLKKGPEGVAVCGMSMGGYGALRLGAKYPKVFGKAVGIASGIVTGEVAKTLREDADLKEAFRAMAIQSRKTTMLDKVGDESAGKAGDQSTDSALGSTERERFYLTVGEEDPLLEDNEAFHLFLQEQGIPHQFHTAPGEHDYSFAGRQMTAIFNWLQ